MPAPSIYDAWITKAIHLAPGESIYIPCEDKVEQKGIEKLIKQATQRLPLDHQFSLRITKTFKDKRLWVLIAKKDPRHEEAFAKVRDGAGGWRVERTSLGTDPDRIRALTFMVEDGYALDEVERMMESPLSDLEREMFFPTIPAPKEVS